VAKEGPFIAGAVVPVSMGSTWNENQERITTECSIAILNSSKEVDQAYGHEASGSVEVMPLCSDTGPTALWHSGFNKVP
jgi:hypothetical protein